MGFKLNYQLLGPGASSYNGTNTVGLPFNRQSGIDTAKALMDDIGSANVVNVQRLVEATNAIEVYTGRTGTPDPDFPLAYAEAYFIKMSADSQYIVVGSHDPSTPVSLDAPGAGSYNGTNFFAYPYHATFNTAKGLMDDIGSGNVVNVQRLVESTNAIEVYTGRTGTPDPDFSLVAGEGYFIKMSATVSYTPSHY
jgi:hypothetical protein